MALSVLAALYHRDLTGEGQWIDASQTEAGIMLTQVPVLDFGANGRAWERNGNRSVYQAVAPQGVYRCAGDDRWIAITCASEDQWRALAHLAGHDDWLADPRFLTVESRMAHHDALDVLLEGWTRSFEPYDLMMRLQSAGVPAGVCQTAGDRCDNDPQLRHLGWLTELTGTRIGRWPLAEVPVRMSRTPPYLGGRPDRAAPLYGEDNAAILTGLLGMSADEVAELTEQGVLYRPGRLAAGAASPPSGPDGGGWVGAAVRASARYALLAVIDCRRVTVAGSPDPAAPSHLPPGRCGQSGRAVHGEHDVAILTGCSGWAFAVRGARARSGKVFMFPGRLAQPGSASP